MALVAMLLLGAVSAGSAAAAEFASSGGFPVKFSGEGEAGLLETVEGRSVTCTEGSASGEVAGSKEAKATVVFKGCHAEHFPLLTCTTAGKASGEIATKSMKGTPVNLDTTKTDVGILLQPASGEVMAEFNCSFGFVNETLIVKGAVIGKVQRADVNKETATIHLEFKALKGKQEYTQIEGAGTQYFLTTEGEGTAPFKAEQSGINEAIPGSTVLTAEGGTKIKIVP